MYYGILACHKIEISTLNDQLKTLLKKEMFRLTVPTIII